MASAIRIAALPFMLATMVACGGGGGGGGVLAPATAPSDTSAGNGPGPGQPPGNAPGPGFSTVGPNETLVMEGTAALLSGNSSGTGITGFGTGPVYDATAKFSYDGTRDLSAMEAMTPSYSFRFDRSAGHTVRCDGGGVCEAENLAAGTSAVVVDPNVVGWSYQSLGVWGTTELSSGRWNLTAISAGLPTSGSALPSTGTATFRGIAVGAFVDTANVRATTATMRADVNFGSRSVLFSTASTKIAGTPNAGFDLSGTMTYAQGVNAFSGTLRSVNGQMNGQAAGRFFGPAAQEIGGVYALHGSSFMGMIGGFGGKR
jgi:transferrin binding protein